MRQVLGILIIIGVLYLAKQLYSRYEEIRLKQERAQQGQSQPVVPPGTLPGMPPSLEGSLQAAQRQGASGLKTWLRNYRVYVRDPRLGAIELDYVVLVSPQDPAEAKRVFQAVKARTPPSSPLRERIKKLEKTYE